MLKIWREIYFKILLSDKSKKQLVKTKDHTNILQLSLTITMGEPGIFFSNQRLDKFC